MWLFFTTKWQKQSSNISIQRRDMKLRNWCSFSESTTSTIGECIIEINRSNSYEIRWKTVLVLTSVIKKISWSPKFIDSFVLLLMIYRKKDYLKYRYSWKLFSTIHNIFISILTASTTTSPTTTSPSASSKFLLMLSMPILYIVCVYLFYCYCISPFML